MKPNFNPTTDQTYELVADAEYDFLKRKEHIDKLVAQGRYDEACDARYQAFITLAEALPEDEAMPLSWEHSNSRAALDMLYGSAIDHFIIGDLEMSMAQLELLLDSDPEDHFEAVNLLALCYVACEEWELFDELALDLSDKSAEAVVVRLWASLCREGVLDKALLDLLRMRHRAYFDELRLDEHPDTPQYRADIASERPSLAAVAREWWLMTEPLWREFPEFVEALRAR